MKDTSTNKRQKNVMKNQLFMWKLCFKTCPWYMIYFLYDGFRYQGIIFLEHVLGIRYVLHCAEFHEPFMKAFIYIGYWYETDFLFMAGHTSVNQNCTVH